jgi:large subunit ribosomal protein L24
MPATIHREDQVKVISGRDKGKIGRVLEVFPDKHRVLVEHVMMSKKHTRPNPAKQIKGGIAERESPIDISNVQLICPACNAPRRVALREERDPQGRRLRSVRVCRKCGNVLDTK